MPSSEGNDILRALEVRLVFSAIDNLNLTAVQTLQELDQALTATTGNLAFDRRLNDVINGLLVDERFEEFNALLQLAQ